MPHNLKVGVYLRNMFGIWWQVYELVEYEHTPQPNQPLGFAVDLKYGRVGCGIYRGKSNEENLVIFNHIVEPFDEFEYLLLRATDNQDHI